jgi:hypothetical protein
MMVITASPDDGYYSVTWWWLFQNRIMHTIFDIYIFITHCIVMKLNSTWQTIITCNFLITNKWDFITQLWKNSRKHIWCPANHIFSMDAYLGAYFFLKNISSLTYQFLKSSTYPRQKQMSLIANQLGLLYPLSLKLEK